MPKAVTLDEFRTRVRFLGHFENSIKITNARLDEAINAAIESTWDVLLKARPDAFEREASASAAAGVVPLPADFYKLRGVCWLEGTIYRRARPCTTRDMPRLSQYTGGDRYWYRFQAATYPNLGPSLAITPAPATTIPWRVFYLPSATTLVADADAWDSINGYDGLVIALAICDLKGRDNMPLDPWDGQAAAAKREILDSARDIDTDEPFYLSGAPAIDEDDDADDRWA